MLLLLCGATSIREVHNVLIRNIHRLHKSQILMHFNS